MTRSSLHSIIWGTCRRWLFVLLTLVELLKITVETFFFIIRFSFLFWHFLNIYNVNRYIFRLYAALIQIYFNNTVFLRIHLHVYSKLLNRRNNYNCFYGSLSKSSPFGRVCGTYQDFIDRGLLLTRKLLNQEFLLVKLKSSLRKCYGLHHDLVNRYGTSVS
jgi:hypothetical protein